MRIKIQNAVKMVVKKFQFPCMRNIIFEVIHMLIMQADTLLTFDHTTYAKLIEIINLNGMSVNKIKRILRILITDFFLYNEMFLVHQTQLSLFSHKQFDQKVRATLLSSLKSKVP